MFALANTYLHVVVFSAWPQYPDGVLGGVYTWVAALLWLPQTLGYFAVRAFEEFRSIGLVSEWVMVTVLSVFQYTLLTTYVIRRRTGRAFGPGLFTAALFLVAAICVAVSVSWILKARSSAADGEAAIKRLQSAPR